jgi:hypothetical protein
MGGYELAVFGSGLELVASLDEHGTMEPLGFIGDSYISVTRKEVCAWYINPGVFAVNVRTSF